MVGGTCKLGNQRPKICKDFPRKQSDIDNCGKTLNQKSTCVATIGGKDCNHCGQCCKDHPWSLQGKYKDWQDENGVCIYYEGN